MDNLKVIKIFEDKPNKLILSDEEVKDILSIRNIIGDENVILQTDGRLTIKHYVGFFQVKKTRLLIYPKISMKAEETYDKSLKILLKLLSYTGFIGIKRIPSPQDVGRYQGDLLELFVNIFADELLYQFKRDVSRNYNENIENQTFIKGKIDFPETIKKNIYNKHLHYVKYHEFTENILLNQIFKTIINNLITSTLLKENKIKLREALLWLMDTKTIRLTNEIWDHVQFTRMNRQYKPVFNLAKLFYYNFNPNLNRGQDNTFSFLVPLNQLFEYYLYKLLKKNEICRREINYQSPIKYLAKIDGDNFRQLRPDITITKGNKIEYIIDAKYKDCNLSSSDIYQMLAYSIRYECTKLSLIYPKYLEKIEKGMEVSQIEINNYDKKVEIKIIKADLEMEPDVLGNKLNEIFSNHRGDSK